MNDQVKKVRESIKQRKKASSMKDHKNLKTVPLFPSDEERFGTMETTPTIIVEPSRKSENKQFSLKRLKYVMIPFIFFIISSFILYTDHHYFRPAQNWLSIQLKEDFPFAKVNHWYVTTFGQPNSIVPTSPFKVQEENVMPMEGAIVETFAINGNGVKISPNKKTAVITYANGIVIFAGNLKETGKTVVVQHADESLSTYGFLSDIDVFAYQLVRKNDRIGYTNPKKVTEPFFFSVEKNNEFIDPSKVIPVDDIP